MNCKHEWRVNHDNFVEGCIGAICIKCGKTGCGCHVLKQHNNKIPKNFWRKEDTISYKKNTKRRINYYVMVNY